MATTTRRQRTVKSSNSDPAEEAVEVVQDQLEELARKGARQILMVSMDEEVDGYLGRGRYDRSGEFRGYRNGSTPRRLTLSVGRSVGTATIWSISSSQTGLGGPSIVPIESKRVQRRGTF